jgi:HSP20 family protein
MNLIKRNNMPALREDFIFPFEQQFNSLFDHFFENSSMLDGVKASSGYPKMDIISDDVSLTVKVALPGLEPEDVTAEILSNNVLKLSGKKSDSHVSENSTYLTKELRTSRFSRCVTLPDWVKDDPAATMKNGILTLVWQKPPQVEKKSEQKLIEIKKE